MNKLFKDYKIITGIFLTIIFIISIYVCYSYAAKRSLYFWSNNQDVKTLQWKLSQWGYYDGRIDGIFGPETWVGVKEFQRKNGLRPDGVVGSQTWAALGYTSDSITSSRETRTRPAVSTNVNRNNNVELIARLIHAEARGEPFTGQVAVAAVLLNRVEDPAFPNSISGVIYQPAAFESVSNGQFNLPANSENIRAARSAINGWDPTHGSVFFWNPSKPVNKWIWTRDTVRTIGSHIFAH